MTILQVLRQVYKWKRELSFHYFTLINIDIFSVYSKNIFDIFTIYQKYKVTMYQYL
jgi:hypothetical protein